MKNNKPLPTLVLRNKIKDSVFKNYQVLLANKKKLACESQIGGISPFLLNNWLERMYLERLESKSVFIKQLLLETKNDYEAVLFMLLAKNFGLKVNGEAFLNLAKSVDFRVIKKESFREETLSALLFGQAGFLDEVVSEENQYIKTLKKEYTHLKHKYSLQSIHKSQFQFFRMRPANFPTIRIAQLVALYVKNTQLFSKVIALNNLASFYKLFEIEVGLFWKNHYTFEKESKRSSKRLTKNFVNLLLINTVIPLKFVFFKEHKRVEEDFFYLIKQIPSEKNTIISNFIKCNIKVESGFDSQALLQLHNNYCVLKKCLQCGVGNSLLRKN